MKINPYLNFGGDCREAFEFYETVLGGTISMIMPYADMPPGEDDFVLPEGWEDKVMHVSLQVGDVTLMGSDMPGDQYIVPQGIHISLSIETPEQAETVFAALSESGTVTMPLMETFWAHRFGTVTDRFGTPWMINCEKPMD